MLPALASSAPPPQAWSPEPSPVCSDVCWLAPQRPMTTEGSSDTAGTWHWPTAGRWSTTRRKDWNRELQRRPGSFLISWECLLGFSQEKARRTHRVPPAGDARSPCSWGLWDSGPGVTFSIDSSSATGDLRVRRRLEKPGGHPGSTEQTGAPGPQPDPRAGQERLPGCGTLLSYQKGSIRGGTMPWPEHLGWAAGGRWEVSSSSFKELALITPS